MSRIGKKPIAIIDGASIEINDPEIIVKGPKGELKFKIHPTVKVIKQDNIILIKRKRNDKLARSIHGLTNRIVNNMIIGVTSGFSKKLDYKGVGYKITTMGDKMNFIVGYSHPVEIIAPKGISFQIQKNVITVSGIDKQLVGQVAAQIRAIKPVEPYKGKGIKYVDEYVKRKQGKIAKAAGAGTA